MRARVASTAVSLFVVLVVNTFGQNLSTPFEFHQGVIFLEIRTGGNDTLFCLFDTGAEVSAIDEATADRLRLPVIDTTEVEGSNAVIRTEVVRMKDLWLNDYHVPTIAPTKRDLSHSLAPDGRMPDMILGYDFFRNAILEIDFTSQVLTLHRDTLTIDYPSFIPFTLDHNIPRFSGRINDTLAIDFRLDTGAGLFETDDLYINITSDDWERIIEADPELRPTVWLSATGINSEEIRLPVARVERVEVGEMKVEHPWVIVQPRIGYFASPDAVGFVSNNLLRRYRNVAIDYLNNRLWYSGADALR